MYVQELLGWILIMAYPKKIAKALPYKCLLTIYKSYVTLDFGYSNIGYDQSNNESFQQKTRVSWHKERFAVKLFDINHNKK